MSISKIGVTPVFAEQTGGDNETHMYTVTGIHTTVAASDTVITGLKKVVSVTTSLNTDPITTAANSTADIGDQAGSPASGSILLNTWESDFTVATTFSVDVSWVAVGF